jgi:hypothetical protein
MFLFWGRDILMIYEKCKGLFVAFFNFPQTLTQTLSH